MSQTLGSSATTIPSMSLDHVAIMVPNMEEGVNWYVAKFGAQIVDRWDNPEAGMEWTHLEIGSFKLELVKRVGLDERVPNAWGYHHVAFQVADCDATVAALESAGVTVVMPPSNFERHEIRWAFVADYLGNIFEIISSAKSTVV